MLFSNIITLINLLSIMVILCDDQSVPLEKFVCYQSCNIGLHSILLCNKTQCSYADSFTCNTTLIVRKSMLSILLLILLFIILLMEFILFYFVYNYFSL